MSSKTGGRPRGRPKTVDRQRAVDAAMAIYWQEGLFAMSLNALCRRIGISKPALYREFGDEDGLMEAALDAYRARVVVPLLHLMAADLPYAATLDAVVAGATDDQSRPAGCVFTRMRLARARLGPRTAARVEAIEQERRTAFERRHRRALAAGQADPDIDPTLAAGYLDSQLTSLLVHMAAGEPPATLRDQGRLAFGVLQAAPVAGR